MSIGTINNATNSVGRKWESSKQGLGWLQFPQYSLCQNSFLVTENYFWILSLVLAHVCTQSVWSNMYFYFISPKWLALFMVPILFVHSYPVKICDTSMSSLTHRGRVTHTCVGNVTIIGPDNGLSPGRRQAIIWTNVGILLTGPWGTNFNEILIGIQTFSFKKIHLKMSSAKWRPFCLGLNVLI